MRNPAPLFCDACPLSHKAIPAPEGGTVYRRTDKTNQQDGP